MFHRSNKSASTILLCLLFLNACKELPQSETRKLEKQDRLERAMEQEFMMTQDPALGYIPKERLATAKGYMNSLLAGRLNGLNALNWTERGPNNVAGRTRALIIDSRDASGNTVIAASVSGGIWRATNFKSTPVWTPVAEQMGSIAVNALAQHPTAPDTMYAGTGEGWFNIDAVRGNGIWKSINGGTTWTKLASTDSTVASSTGNTLHRFDYVQDLVVTSNNAVFAALRPSKFCNIGGVVRSTDGGANWQQVIGTLTAQVCDSAYNYYAADLEVASNGDLYATTGFRGAGIINNGRIFRSPAASNGVVGSWVDITPAGDWKRIEMAVSPSNSAVLYALFQGTGDGIDKIKKSLNSGGTWTDVPLPTWCNQGTSSNDFTNGQAFYDLIVQVDPTNSNNVIIGGIDLFRSTDGGAMWTQISQWAQGCGTLPNVHADQHNVLFYPGSSTELIASNDGGVYYSNNSGIGWTAKNGGYNVTQFYALDLHPTQPNYFLAGSQDNGTQKFTSAGMNATTRASGGDGAFSHIDQTDGNLQISAFVYNYYFYSRNGGTSFIKAPGDNENGMFINPTDYDDVADVLYTSNSPDQMGVLTNIGGSGNPSFNAVSLSGLAGRTISAIKVDPTVSSGGTLWVAGYKVPTDASNTTSAPVLLKLTGANTLSPAVTVTATPLNVSGAYISSIDVDPGDAAHLLVTVSNYGVASVLESFNNGTTWSNIEDNLPDVPVRWGLFLPASTSLNGSTPRGIVVGTEVSVWTKLPGAATWNPETPSLPNVRVDMLKFRASDNTLAAATHGRGLWTTTLTGLSTGLPTVANTKDFIRYTAAANGRLFIKAGNLTAITKMQTRIVDAGGRLVRSADTRYADQSLDLNGLARGSYVLKIIGSRGEQYTRQFIH